MDESLPPTQRDDGHGGEGGGQRRRGDATAVIYTTVITSLADGYNAGICGCETIVVSCSENGGVGSFIVVDVSGGQVVRD